MTEKVQLGKFIGASGKATILTNDESKIQSLEQDISIISEQINIILNKVNILSRELLSRTNNEKNIPFETTFIGKTNGDYYFLKSKNDGFYVGDSKYQSLSAAAEAVSGCRRSGWTFWKLPDGRTAKEVFRG